MSKKETFEKMTTAQFLLMQLRRKRGKEIEAEFHNRREQGRVLAFLKMADGQALADMATILGMEPEALEALAIDLESQGLIAFEGVEHLEEAAAEEPAVDEVEAAEAEVEEEEAVNTEAEASEGEQPAEITEFLQDDTDEDEDEPAEEPEEVEEAQPAAKPSLANATIHITESGKEWVMPPTDLPGLLLAEFEEDELAAFGGALDKFIGTLEKECGASASQLMEEERKRREEEAREKESRDNARHGGRDRGDKRDRDRGGYGKDKRGFGGKGRDDRKGRGGDRGGGYGKDKRGFGGDRRGGFGSDRGREDRGGGFGRGFGKGKRSYGDDRRSYGER